MNENKQAVGTLALDADQRVTALFTKLQQKKAEVASAERPQYITGGAFRYSESIGNSIDIMTVRDERKLVEILAFLKDRKKSYTEAAEELNVKANFTWLNFTVEEWTKDLKTRVSVIQLSKRKAELAELEIRVNTVMSPELRARMEMEALEAALSE